MVNILVQQVSGRIVNYRIGPKTQMSKECLVQFENVGSNSLAGKFVGQKVVWKMGNNMLTGKIVGLHGKNGMVRVKFTQGVPGQALGTTVQLVS